MYNPTRQI